MRPSVAILGAGSIGEILAKGLLRAGWDPADIVMAARRAERAEETEAATGISTVVDAAAALPGRQVVVVAVKPKDVPALLDAVAPAFGNDQILLSLAAGVPTSIFEDRLGEIPVVRAMPNTPAAVDEGMTAFCGGRFTDMESMAQAERVLEAVGETIHLQEDLLDAVTAVSGTGPAYVFLLAEALIEAAVREGLPHHAATKLVDQTVRGAGILLAESGLTPFELRAQVTSPGGTTAAAMHILEEGGYRAAIEDAVRAAAERSRELGHGADPVGG